MRLAPIEVAKLIVVRREAVPGSVVVGTQRVTARDWPTFSPESSPNQRLPSGPFAMPSGKLDDDGSGNSVITPDGVIRPIFPLRPSANQRLPSGPVTIACGREFEVGIGNSVTTPAV